MLILRKFNFSTLSTLKNNLRTFVNIIHEPGEVETDYDVPDHIIKPHYFYELNEPANLNGNAEINNENQIERIRKSCKIAANILKRCHKIVKVRKIKSNLNSSKTG